MELCEDKSFVLGVCLCDACGVVCPESVVCWWRTGGPSPCVVVVILVVAYCGTWDFTTRVVVKGERWCGLVSGSNRVGCCRYEPELEVGMVCSTGLLISEFAMLLFLISL